MSESYFIEKPTPPIMLEPGLVYAGHGETTDGKVWIKFINSGHGRLRTVYVTILASSFRYHYAIRDRTTGTITGYQGPFGDPDKDESFIYGDEGY